MSYTPNIALHPGRTIAKALDKEGLTQKSLSERMGITEKHLSFIINGVASITSDTALLLENALGGSASFWMNLEKEYQITKSRIERKRFIEEETKLICLFPYKELEEIGFVVNSNDKEEKVLSLMRFFAVNSLTTIKTTESIAFRKKDSTNIKNEHIAAWLRCGEILSKKLDLPEYSDKKLMELTTELKLLSTKSEFDYLTIVTNLLNDAGVGLIFLKQFSSTKLSGAVRWINKNPIIQLSFFNKWADIFWFNLYHEIGHILLHGKKNKFLEFDDKKMHDDLENDAEIEANKFARDKLIHPVLYKNFLNQQDFSKLAITKFASTINIHPGIVAGRLCFDKHVKWEHIRQLRKLIDDKSIFSKSVN